MKRKRSGRLSNDFSNLIHERDEKYMDVKSPIQYMMHGVIFL